MPGVEAGAGIGRSFRSARYFPWFAAFAAYSLLAGCGGGGGGPPSPAVQVPSAALSTVVVTPGEGLEAHGVDDAVVVIIARDTLGHTISGLTVTLAASGTNNVLTQPPTVTNPLGAASGHV